MGKKKIKITEDFNSADIESSLKKSTATDRIREKINKFIEKQKQEKAFRKTPEFRQKQIDRLNQIAELELAKAKVARAKASIATANTIRRKAQFEGFNNIFGSNSLLGGSVLNQKDSFVGMNELVGFGSSMKTSKVNKVPKSGFDELFGV